MGIYTSAGFSGSSIDIYSPAEEELCCEGFDINFYEASMVAVAESEAIYNNSMKEVGIAELRYFEENGQEVIYEAVDVKAIFNKIKMFFKKLIDKVKAIFHTFIAKLSSFVQSDKDFVKKYEKEFSRKWNDVKEDFEFKGYKFTIKNETSFNEPNQDYDFSIGIGTNTKSFNDTLSNPKTIIEKKSSASKSDVDNLNNTIKKIKDNYDEICEEIRGDAFEYIKECFSTYSGNIGSNRMDAKDFSEELFKLFRNNESSKENIEKKDIDGGVATITSELRTADKTKKVAEKASKWASKYIENGIKALDKMESELLKEIPNKEKKDDITNYTSACISYCSEYSGLLKCQKEYAVQGCGACLQALKDRSRQYKAIMVKVISGSKKMQRESYDYTNESYDGSGSFLDSVVLK